MAVNRAQIRDLLLPGLREVEGRYPQIPAQWPQVFQKSKSNLALERTAEMRFLGLGQVKTEGAATAFDNGAGERWVYNQQHFAVSLGYSITREAIADNLYKSEFQPTNLGLAESLAQTKELFAADILNTATTFNAAIGGDQVALCSTAHPIDGTTVANRPTVDVDLNESSLLNAMTSVARFRDVAGLLVFARGRKLVVPRALEPVAIRLLKTELRPGTADNDVNAILTTAGGLPEGHLVMDFLTSNYAWFLLTSVKGLNYMEREPFEMDMQAEFNTDNLLVKAYERYSFGYSNWRSIYGSFPTA